MNKIYKNKKGYTLVEMVLVIAIIVILAGVLALNISTYLDRAKNGQSKVDASVDSMNANVSDMEQSMRNYNF